MINRIRIELSFKCNATAEGHFGIALSRIAVLCKPTAAINLNSNKVGINLHLPARCFIIKHSRLRKFAEFFITKAVVIIIAYALNNCPKRLINFIADFMQGSEIHHSALNQTKLAGGKLGIVGFGKFIGINLQIFVFNSF